MSYLYEKSEQLQNDKSVNSTLENQSLHGDSLFAESHEKVLKYEQQQWDIKPDPYLPPKQELTPSLNFKSEEPASTLNLSHHDQHHQDDKTIISTQHQENQAYISMTSSKEYNGLYFFFIDVRHSKNVCVLR